MTDRKLARDAVEFFGEDSQKRQTIEECAELIVALNHLHRGRCTEDEVVYELADVIIMCEQLAEILGPQRVAEKLREKRILLRDRLSVVPRQI